MNELSKAELLNLLSTSSYEETAVTATVQSYLRHAGDLDKVVIDIAAPPDQFGVGSFLKSLVDETFEALLGKDELIDRLEEARRSFSGAVATSVLAGAGVIAGATGLTISASTIVFLYLLPIGVRAAYREWELNTKK